MMIAGKRLVRLQDEPTCALDWGQVKFLSEPRLTNAENLSVVHVTLAPGQGHVRHNHPGSEEILYVLSGEGEQMVETDLEEMAASQNSSRFGQVMLFIYRLPGFIRPST